MLKSDNNFGFRTQQKPFKRLSKSIHVSNDNNIIDEENDQRYDAVTENKLGLMTGMTG